MHLRFASLLLLGATLAGCPEPEPLPPDASPLNARFADATDVQVRRMVESAIGQDASVARWLLDRILTSKPGCAEITVSDGIATLTAPAGCATPGGWKLEGTVTFESPYDLARDNDVRFDRLTIDGPLDDDTVVLDGNIRWEYDEANDLTSYLSLTVTRAGVPVRARMITHTGEDPSAFDDGQVNSAIGTAAVVDDGGVLILAGEDTLVFEPGAAGCGVADVAGEDRELCLFRATPSRFANHDVRSVSAVCDGDTTTFAVDTMEPLYAEVDLAIGSVRFELEDSRPNGDGGYTYSTSDGLECVSLAGNDYTVHVFGSVGVKTLAEYLVEPPASWGT
jgi:hypothetical protein